MKRKKVILTLSREFPKTHSKANHSTLFAINLMTGRKLHTIRDDDKGLWEQRIKDVNEGYKVLCVREWMGAPYNSEQRDVKQYVKVGLQRLTMTYGVDDDVPQAWVDGKEVSVETLAANDGLRVPDFVEWFFGKTNKTNQFEGVILHFTDFRY